METTKKSNYQVIYTNTAEHYFLETLTYIYQNHTLTRAEELIDELVSLAQSLEVMPQRGALEKWLVEKVNEYRFLLFRRTKRSGVKIVYFIEESSKKVFITDFFPTEMDPEEMIMRTK